MNPNHSMCNVFGLFTQSTSCITTINFYSYFLSLAMPLMMLPDFSTTKVSTTIRSPPPSMSLPASPLSSSPTHVQWTLSTQFNCCTWGWLSSSSFDFFSCSPSLENHHIHQRHHSKANVIHVCMTTSTPNITTFARERESFPTLLFKFSQLSGERGRERGWYKDGRSKVLWPMSQDICKWKWPLQSQAEPQWSQEAQLLPV